MKWEIAKLGKIAIIRTGKLDSNAAVIGGRYPFFTCDPNTLSIDVWAYDTEAVLLAGNNASGNYTAKYYKGKFNAYQRTYIIESANEEELNIRYLYYALNQQLRLLKTMSSGSTTKFLTVRMLDNLDIPLLGINIQTQIVNILSAYDDLIENNQKQIKLLEGVPEGWKKERLVDIAEIQYGYAFDGTLFNADKNGTPIIRIRNIPRAETMDYTTEHVSENYLVQNGEIIVGMDGEFHINAWAGNTAYLVQRVCCIRPKNTEIKGWLLQAIYEPIKFFERTVVGATVAHLGKKHLDSIYLLTSPEGFYKPFMILFDKRLLLENQNRKLREARDRLLPKLMSGEVEV